MKYNFLTLILSLIVLTSCEKEINPFLITKHNIGYLTDSTQVKNLESVFANDSIVKYVSGDEFTGDTNDIQIYEKGGSQLLTLSPSQSLDSTTTIRTVEVIDARFSTIKGLSPNSTFKDINTNYKISNIQNSLRSIIVSVDEINAYFTIDKSELPANMRFDMNLKIEAIQIPEEAKINNFYLYWRD